MSLISLVLLSLTSASINYGFIDELTCDSGTLLSVNQEIAPILTHLKQKLFFKIFKLKLDNECPFWAQNYFCELASCAVCECPQDEIPSTWLEDPSSQLDLRISDSFYIWKSEQSWMKADSPDTYVNLLLNSEAYTHYQGQHIWAAIYNENCFTSQICTEERFFYQLISGLHANINCHISYNYLEPGSNFGSLDAAMSETHPNVQMYLERVGNFPDRVRNFYFAFAVLLRAVNKAAEFISNYNIATGNSTEDAATHELVWDLLNTTTRHCSIPFDEQQLFVDPKSWILKEEIRLKFYNISRIIDCVGCEKCKLHGKLQITGLGAALKILFEPRPYISRNELIALMNTLAKFSRASDIMLEMQDRTDASVAAWSVVLAAVVLWLCVKLTKLV